MEDLKKIEDEWMTLYGRAGTLPVKEFLGLYYNAEFIGEIIKRKPKWILEIGCGRGIFSIFLSQLGFNVIGVDRLPKMVEMARSNNKDYNGDAVFMLADIRDLPFEDNSFDLIFSQGSLQCLDRIGLKLCFREQERIAKKSILINVPNTNYFNTSFNKEIRIFATAQEWVEMVATNILEKDFKITHFDEKFSLTREKPFRTLWNLFRNKKTETNIMIDLLLKPKL